MVKKCIMKLTDQGDLSININKEEMFMKKRVIFSCVILTLAAIIFIVVSQYISKLSDDIDKNDEDDSAWVIDACLDSTIPGAKIVSVDKDNTFTIEFNEEFNINKDSYKKGDSIRIKGNDFETPKELENDAFKYIDRKIKSVDEYEYYPGVGDVLDIWYLGDDEDINLENPTKMYVKEYGSRISGTVISTRVLSREPIKDNNTENIRTQECATVKISDIQCEQECAFKKGDTVEIMYGSVYSGENELADKVLQKGDKVSYGFGRHDSERYSEYKQKDPFIMTPQRVDLESDTKTE